jgi:hypothetical protein
MRHAERSLSSTIVALLVHRDTHQYLPSSPFFCWDFAAWPYCRQGGCHNNPSFAVLPHYPPLGTILATNKLIGRDAA